MKLDEFLSEWADGSDRLLVHTSGSTGTPKGVTIPHRGILNFVLWAKDTFSWDEGTVIANSDRQEVEKHGYSIHDPEVSDEDEIQHLGRYGQDNPGLE